MPVTTTLAARAAAMRDAASPASAAPVASPCLSVCRMDPTRALCEGCFRTLDEIAAWSRLDDEGKRAVWRRIDQRITGTPTP